MSIKHYRQKTIVATDAQSFDDSMNKLLSNLASSGNDIEIHYYNDGFKATVKYSIEDYLEESEYSETFFCGDCIHYVRPLDKRKKYVRCTYPAHDRLIKSKSVGCELYYPKGECIND